MEYFYVLCVMFMNCAVLFQGVKTNEFMMNLMSKVISNEKKIDGIEVQLQELKTNLFAELNTITELLKQHEPGMGEITKDIKDTISNTVTQMVRSQYVVLSKAMKQEKAAMLKTSSEVKQHMHVMNTAFNNSQRHYEERFTNQTAEFQDELNTHTERADVLQETLKEMKNELLKTLNDETSLLKSGLTSEISSIQGDLRSYKSSADGIGSRVSSLNTQMTSVQRDLRSYKSSADAIGSRVSSLNTQMTSVQRDLRSYKSSADAIGSRVSSVEGRMTSHNIGFTAKLTNKLPSIAKETRIVFDEEYYDGWSDYDTSTGIFKAPISGMYLFMFTVECYFGELAHICLYISGGCRADAIARGDGDITGSNFYVTYLSAGTQVWVQTPHLRSTYDIWPYRTTFSGVLIHI